MLIRASCERLPLADDSVDMVFTDPPYLREYLPCYGWLAREAMRVLKPGGFVLAMCGGVYLNEIYRMFDDAGMFFVWENRIDKQSHNPGLVWLAGGNSVMTTSKPIITYSKGKPNKTDRFTDVFSQRTMPDKRYHHWGQDVDSARYFIERFSKPGDVVLDPFIGGGTTAVACELIGRRWIGCDVDPVALATTKARMAVTDIYHNLPMFAAVPL